jgi:flagellar biosynthesis protein FlhF
VRLKSFHAASMAEAMRMVRSALGDDAIIVATREEEGGVRVTAAIDESEAPSAPPPPAPVEARRPPPRPPRPQPEIDVGDVIADALRRHGTPHAVADRIVTAAEVFDTDDPLLALGAGLDSIYDFNPLPDRHSEKPIMLVGPPGAGKTLTVAKLAARATLGGRLVGVITTDTVRAGGIDQLQAFTRLLKLRLLAVEDTLALADALLVQQGLDQVLIDSAGRNPFDNGDMADLAELLEAAEVEPVLVLPGGGDPVEAAEIAQSFRELGVTRLLVTRLDMTRRLGGLLSIAHEADMAFSDVSVTPKVAEGLTPLNPISLARLLLPSAVPARRAVKQTGTFS